MTPKLQSQVHVKKISEIKASICSILDTVATWFLQQGMKVNGAKTEFIVCGDTRQLQRIKDPTVLSFMGATIQSSKFVKNLGVYMDETLSWDHHIKTIIRVCPQSSRTGVTESIFETQIINCEFSPANWPP